MLRTKTPEMVEKELLMHQTQNAPSGYRNQGTNTTSTSGRKSRPLGIPTVTDRVVQQAVRVVLEPIYECRFAELGLFSLVAAECGAMSLHRGVKR